MRLIRHAALVVIAFALSGCLIQQQAPQPQAQKEENKISGVISMLELRFAGSGAAAVLAGFNKLVPDDTKLSEATSRLVPFDLHALDRVSFAAWSQFGFSDPRTRGGRCQKMSGPRPDRAGQEGLKLGEAVSMGKLRFGLNHQNIFQTMPEDEGHTYGLSLTPPVPAGEYLVRAEGNKKLNIGGFDVSFAMPEAITGVRINGNYIDVPGVEIPRNQPLKLEWDAPSVPNDQTAIGLILISQDMLTRQVLMCAGMENDVTSYDAHGRASWTIDPSWLADLIDGDGTQVYLTREILTAAEGNGLHIDLEGIRKWMSVAIVR